MKWTPTGLGGYGNMSTPAVSRRVSSTGRPPTPRLIVNCDMGGAYLSRDLGQTWQLLHYRELPGNVTVRPAFSPKDGQSDKDFSIIAGGNWGDVRRSIDGGRTFVSITGCCGLPFNDQRLQGEIAIDPVFHNVIFVGASDDSEFTGYRLFDKSRCTNIVPDQGPNSIWQSVDSGQTWQRVAHWDPSGNEADFNEAFGFVLGFHADRRFPDRPLKERLYYAATQRGILVSHNGGATWKKCESKGLPVETDGKPLIRSFTGYSSPNSHLFLYCTIATQLSAQQQIDGGVYVSIDCGAWKRVLVAEEPSDGGNAEENACCLLQFHRIVASQGESNIVQVLAANTGYAEDDLNEGVHSTVYRSNGGTEKWQRTFYPFPSKKDYYTKHNVTHNWATVQSVQRSPDEPDGWPWVSEEPGNDAAVCPDDPGIVLLTGTRCYVRRPDATSEWLSADSPTDDPASAGPDTRWKCNGLVVTTTWHYYVHPHVPERHHIAYTDCNHARSDDRGDSWVWGKFELANENSPWQNTVYEFALDPRSSCRMWGAFSSLHDIPNGSVVLHYQEPTTNLKGSVGYSDDGGKNWSYKSKFDKVDSKNKHINPVTSVVWSPGEPTPVGAPPSAPVLYAAVFEDGIYQAIDTGGPAFSWKSITYNLQDRANKRFFRLIAHKDGTLFALITARTIRTKDGIFFDESNDGVGLYRLDRGKTKWEQVGAAHKPRLDWPRDFAVDPDDSARVFIAASEPKKLADRLLPGSRDPVAIELGRQLPRQSGVYAWDKRNDTWKQLNLHGMPPSYRHFGVYLHPHNSEWLYLTLNGDIGGVVRKHSGLWLSKDGGATCEPFTELPFKNIHRVSFDTASPHMIYVCTNGAGIWRGPAQPSNEDKYVVG